MQSCRTRSPQPSAWRETLSASMAVGVRIDMDSARNLRASLVADIADAEERIADIAGERFNISDGRQLGIVLFESLSLRPVRRVGFGQYGVTKADLRAIDHPIVPLVIAHMDARSDATVIDDVLSRQICGRVHPALDEDTMGGIRLSQPALQSISRRIRGIVVAHPDCVFLSADYRAMHLRLLANLGGDRELAGILTDGRDPFRELGSMLYGIGIGSLTPAQVAAAKAVTYSRLYGSTCGAIAHQHGLESDVVKAYDVAFGRRFGRAGKWRDGMCKQARRDGFVRTICGYSLDLDYLGSRVRLNGTILNAVLQGSQIDVLKEVIPSVACALDDIDGRVMLPLHDELLVQVPLGSEAKAAALLRESMTAISHDLTVPFEVRVKAGLNWGDMHELQG